jgi:hypothetical protein
MTRLYVYGFAGEPLRAFTAQGRHLHTLDIAGVHVVADRELPDAEPTEEALRRQHAIVEALASRTEAILPARFGSIVETAHIRQLLEAGGEAVRTALAHVRGRLQMTVRLPGAPPGDTRAADATTGAAYLERKRAALVQPDPAVLAEVRTAAGDLVRDERIQPARPGQRPVVFHLVDRDRLEEYRVRMAALEGRGVAVSGPVADVRVHAGASRMKKRTTPRSRAAARKTAPARSRRPRKPARRQGRTPPSPAHALDVQELESLRAEIDRLGKAGPPRWNADPEDVRRSVGKLVLTLVEFIRQLLERQAIRGWTPGRSPRTRPRP